MQDKTIIAGVVSEFFRAFISHDLGTVDLATLRPLFLNEAIIIKTCGSKPVVYSFDEFIHPRQKILTDGTLLKFSEKEESVKTDIFGDIAQSFVLYRKHGELNGEFFETYGMKSIQFLRRGARWRIASLIWDDERHGLKLER